MTYRPNGKVSEFPYEVLRVGEASKWRDAVKKHEHKVELARLTALWPIGSCCRYHGSNGKIKVGQTHTAPTATFQVTLIKLGNIKSKKMDLSTLTMASQTEWNELNRKFWSLHRVVTVEGHRDQSCLFAIVEAAKNTLMQVTLKSMDGVTCNATTKQLQVATAEAVEGWSSKWPAERSYGHFDSAGIKTFFITYAAPVYQQKAGTVTVEVRCACGTRKTIPLIHAQLATRNEWKDHLFATWSAGECDLVQCGRIVVGRSS